MKAKFIEHASGAITVLINGKIMTWLVDGTRGPAAAQTGLKYKQIRNLMGVKPQVTGLSKQAPITYKLGRS